MFKNRLREIRESKGLTSTQLGAVLGVEEGTIKSWEMGRTFPKIPMLVNIADYFQIDLNYLCGRELAGNQEELIKLINCLNNDQQEKLMEMLRTLI